MKKLILLSFLLINISTYSQFPKRPKSAVSPNVASLGLYGEIPVSHYTGVPSINIPLYQEKVYDVDLPIELSYHASGVHPDQKPGWVGLGWTLKSGGLITRVVRDMPDESNNPKYAGGANAGFYYYYKVLNTNSWGQRDRLRGVAQNTDVSINKDTEPDEFSFNFLGYSGKFYLNHERKWMVQCDKPIKVEFNGTFIPIPFSAPYTRATNQGYSPSFSGFTITSEDGTKYVFGGTVNAIEYSIDFFDQAKSNWLATTWYLTKIILKNKQEINFIYEKLKDQDNVYIFTHQLYIAVYKNLGNSTEHDDFLGTRCNTSSNTTSISTCYQGNLISASYLRKIETNHGSILFDRSVIKDLNYKNEIYAWQYYNWKRNYVSWEASFLPFLKVNTPTRMYLGWKNVMKDYKLDSITIKNSNNDIVKKIDFTYTDTPTQRLTLLKVKESEKNPYIFEYDNMEMLPGYLSNKTDHWGFYNATDANINNYQNYYNDRNPNTSVSRYGTINRIIYPTGGYTDFEFEPHTYRKQLRELRWEMPCIEYTSDQIAGGLRIKSIKNYLPNQQQPASIKEYFYNSDYLENKEYGDVSSGVLGGQVKYHFDDYIVYAYNDRDSRTKMKAFTSYSVLPSCNNANGSHVGYTEVIEKREDDSFTRYQFSNFDNGYMDESPLAVIQEKRTAYCPYSSKEQDRGLLLLHEEYNSNGIKVKSKSIEYEKNNTTNSNYIRSMSATSKTVCEGSAINYDEGCSYKIYTYLNRPKEVTETFYSLSGEALQINKIEYSYNQDNLLRSETIKNSTGDISEKLFVYSGDLKPYNNCIELLRYADQELYDCLNRCYPIEVSEGEYIDDVRCMAACETQYANEWYPRSKSDYESCLGDAYYFYSGEMYFVDHHVKNYIIYEIHKNKKNGQILLSDAKKYKYEVNDYKHLVYAGLFLFGSKNKTDISMDRLTQVGFHDNRFYNKDGYTYDNYSNIREYFGEEYITTFIWSYCGTHLLAEIKNADYWDVLNALEVPNSFIDELTKKTVPSNSDIDKINTLRAKLPRAQVTTYTYKPLVGMTSKTDSRGLKTTYHYDDLNRLQYVKDRHGKIIKAYDYHYQNQ